MCGNRVEELESRVKELEASVEGLTDELVECKVRLRELENAVDEDLGFAPQRPEEDYAPSGQPASTESANQAQARQRPVEEEPAQAADTTKSDPAQEDDKAEDSETTEIIVA